MPDDNLSPDQERILASAAERIKGIVGTGSTVVFFGTDLAGIVDFATSAAAGAGQLGVIGAPAAAHSAGAATAATATVTGASILGPIGLTVGAAVSYTFGLRRMCKTVAHWEFLREIGTAPEVRCSCTRGSFRCPEVLSYIIEQKKQKAAKALVSVVLSPVPAAMTLYVIGRATWKWARGTKGHQRTIMAKKLYWAARGHSTTRDGIPQREKSSPCPMAVAIINQLFCGNSFSTLIKTTLAGIDEETGDYPRAERGKTAAKIIGEGQSRQTQRGANQAEIDKIFRKLSTV